MAEITDEVTDRPPALTVADVMERLGRLPPSMLVVTEGKAATAVHVALRTMKPDGSAVAWGEDPKMVALICEADAPHPLA
jgi:hypothetical protein